MGPDLRPNFWPTFITIPHTPFSCFAGLSSWARVIPKWVQFPWSKKEEPKKEAPRPGPGSNPDLATEVGIFRKPSERESAALVLNEGGEDREEERVESVEEAIYLDNVVDGALRDRSERSSRPASKVWPDTVMNRSLANS